MPTLTVEPETISEMSVYRTLATTNAGALFRRNAYPAGKKHRRRYRLTWQNATTATLDSLVSLIRTVNATGSLTWTPPGGSSGDYMIVDETVTVTRNTPRIGAATLTVEEV